jgi:inorganic pyrophosphatase/exopolyphosphatase
MNSKSILTIIKKDDKMFKMQGKRTVNMFHKNTSKMEDLERRMKRWKFISQ